MLRPKLKIFLKTERSPQEIEKLILKLLRDPYEKLVNFIMFDSSSPPLLINFMIDYSMQKLSLVEQWALLRCFDRCKDTFQFERIDKVLIPFIQDPRSRVEDQHLRDGGISDPRLRPPVSSYIEEEFHRDLSRHADFAYGILRQWVSTHARRERRDSKATCMYDDAMLFLRKCAVINIENTNSRLKHYDKFIPKPRSSTSTSTSTSSHLARLDAEATMKLLSQCKVVRPVSHTSVKRRKLQSESMYGNSEAVPSVPTTAMLAHESPMEIDEGELVSYEYREDEGEGQGDINGEERRVKGEGVTEWVDDFMWRLCCEEVKEKAAAMAPDYVPLQSLTPGQEDIVLGQYSSQSPAVGVSYSVGLEKAIRQCAHIHSLFNFKKTAAATTSTATNSARGARVDGDYQVEGLTVADVGQVLVEIAELVNLEERVLCMLVLQLWTLTEEQTAVAVEAVTAACSSLPEATVLPVLALLVGACLLPKFRRLSGLASRQLVRCFELLFKASPKMCADCLLPLGIRPLVLPHSSTAPNTLPQVLPTSSFQWELLLRFSRQVLAPNKAIETLLLRAFCSSTDRPRGPFRDAAALTAILDACISPHLCISSKTSSPPPPLLAPLPLPLPSLCAPLADLLTAAAAVQCEDSSSSDLTETLDVVVRTLAILQSGGGNSTDPSANSSSTSTSTSSSTVSIHWNMDALKAINSILLLGVSGSTELISDLIISLESHFSPIKLPPADVLLGLSTLLNTLVLKFAAVLHQSAAAVSDMKRLLQMVLAAPGAAASCCMVAKNALLKLDKF